MTPDFAVGATLDYVWAGLDMRRLVAADQQIAWSSVMKDFCLRYDSAGMGGSVSFALRQDWKGQSVFNLGLAWKATPDLTLRAGLNLADNPVPEPLVNPLVPATVKSHYTLGLGYLSRPDNEFNGSLTVAPTSTMTNGDGVTVPHRQASLQLMYTHRF